MIPASRKRTRAKSVELPKRFRCRDKYNRALECEMKKFSAKKNGNPMSNNDVDEHGNYDISSGSSSSRYDMDAN